MNEELTALIVEELKKQRARSAIVRRVCAHGGLSPREAERLVVLISARSRHHPATPRLPWQLFLSIAAVLFGTGLLGYHLQFLVGFLQLDPLTQLTGLQVHAFRMAGLLTGAGMALGGLRGMWRAFGVIFPG